MRVAGSYITCKFEALDFLMNEIWAMRYVLVSYNFNQIFFNFPTTKDFGVASGSILSNVSLKIRYINIERSTFAFHIAACNFGAFVQVLMISNLYLSRSLKGLKTFTISTECKTEAKIGAQKVACVWSEDEAAKLCVTWELLFANARYIEDTRWRAKRPWRGEYGRCELVVRSKRLRGVPEVRKTLWPSRNGSSLLNSLLLDFHAARHFP